MSGTTAPPAAAADRQPVLRPGEKKVAIGCGAAAAALMLAFAGYLWWANTLPPPPPERAAALPNPNGFDACVKAAAALPEVPEDSPLAAPWPSDPAALK